MRPGLIPVPKSVELSDGRLSSADEINYITAPDLAEEEYIIEISETDVKIVSSTDKGAFYADITLNQLRNAYDGKLPTGRICDKPLIAYRGFMLDVGRYFFKVDEVKSLIDIAAAYKLNALHLHLTEDQGWRPQIDKYPKLTEVGSVRARTNWKRTPHGGFYTKQDMRDIVDYAHQKHMIVVPEIDCPAHMRAALAAYPHLGCFGRELKVADHWGVKPDVLCAGKDSTYEFLYSIFDEILEIFTDGILHLGADEALKIRWKKCPDCQRVIKEQGLRDENDLQTYFINRIYREYLKPRGCRAAIWALGDVDDGLDKEIIVHQYSDTADKGLIDSGRDIIASNSDCTYFDFPHALTPLEVSYQVKSRAIEPIKDLFGATICLWTEYVPTLKKAKYLIGRRLPAAAEGFWGTGGNFEGFKESLDVVLKHSPDRDFCTARQAQPKGLLWLRERLFWSTRWKDWEGLTILLDNLKFERSLKKEKKAQEAQK